MDTSKDLIIGRNSVRETLKSGAQVDRIYVVQGISDGSIKELIHMAREAHLVIKEITRYKMDEMCAGLGYDGKVGNHQGIAAQVPAFQYSTLDDMFALAEKRNEKPFIILLDGIQDPQNLGAIIRSAEVLGAHGLVIGKHRSATLTAAVFKASSGAAQYLPVAKVVNINQVIEELKKRGLWVAAADTEGQAVYKADLKGAMALVIGAEGAGISKRTKELCDFTVKIDMCGKTGSLNASAAASIIMYEKRRQDSIDERTKENRKP